MAPSGTKLGMFQHRPVTLCLPEYGTVRRALTETQRRLHVSYSKARGFDPWPEHRLHRLRTGFRSSHNFKIILPQNTWMGLQDHKVILIAHFKNPLCVSTQLLQGYKWYNGRDKRLNKIYKYSHLGTLDRTSHLWILASAADLWWYCSALTGS
jgi:hypothetical protein